MVVLPPSLPSLPSLLLLPLPLLLLLLLLLLPLLLPLLPLPPLPPLLLTVPLLLIHCPSSLPTGKYCPGLSHPQNDCQRDEFVTLPLLSVLP